LFGSKPVNIDEEEEASSEDDDLDALAPVQKIAVSIQKSSTGISSREIRKEDTPNSHSTSRITTNTTAEVSGRHGPSDVGKDDPAPLDRPLLESRARLARRRGQNGLQQVKKEEPPEKDLDLDVIPTFL